MLFSDGCKASGHRLRKTDILVGRSLKLSSRDALRSRPTFSLATWISSVCHLHRYFHLFLSTCVLLDVNFWQVHLPPSNSRHEMSVGTFASYLTHIITALPVGNLARVMTPVSFLKVCQICASFTEEQMLKISQKNVILKTKEPHCYFKGR